MKILFLILSVISFAIHAIYFDREKCFYQKAGEKCFYSFDASGKAIGWGGPYPVGDQSIIDKGFTAYVLEDSSGKVIPVQGLQVDSEGRAILQDILTDDLTKPINSKNDIRECGDYCQLIFDGITCTDSEETKTLDLENKQIYCTKTTYEQIWVDDALINDLSKPITTKSEVKECGDFCQLAFDGFGSCTDQTEEKILNLDLKQIYCSKITGYEQKPSGLKTATLDQARLDAYLLTQQKEKELNDTIEKGKNARQACDEVLAYVSGVNQQRVESGAITEAQTTTLETTFTSTFLWLSKGYPGKAKTAINSISVDGTLVTQEMITTANNIFTKYGY